MPPDASFSQPNFLGGELSPSYQGRTDDPDYKHALALCLNYVPNNEGTLTPRSGFKRCGNTKFNDPARLLPFRFSLMYPYVSSFTENDLRIWANGLPVYTPQYAKFVSVSGNPPVFVVLDSRQGSGTLVPPEWNTGDSVMVCCNTINALQNAGFLAQREFNVTVVSGSAGTIKLTDAETGTPLSGTISGLSANDLLFTRIFDFTTVYKYPEGVRQVQFTSQVITLAEQAGNVNITPPDNRVTYLYPLAVPYSLKASTNQGAADPSTTGVPTGIAAGLVQEAFVDGPYMDSFGTNIPMTVSGTTGSIKLTIHGYDSRINYMVGDCVVDYANAGGPFPGYYMSLTNNNLGNALPNSSAPDINANWVVLNVNEQQWASGTTYSGIGVMASVGSDGGSNPIGSVFPQGAALVYYSKIASNTGHYPPTSVADWSTTPPVWGALITYATGSVVTYTSGTVTAHYLAISTPVVGTAPTSAPAVWIEVAVTVDTSGAITPYDLIATAVYDITNTVNGWSVNPKFFIDDAGEFLSGIGLGNPGRLIRLKWGPQPWDNTATYAMNALVNYNDNIFKALVGSNINNQPDTDAVNWEIQTQTIKWTWGEITNSSSHYLLATINLLGDDLPDDNAVWEFRFGLYSDSTGWPTCGVYHEGRLWLGGAQPNRLDGGCTNQGFNMSPTAPDGTVADSNAISLVLNSAENESVAALGSITEGIIVMTSEAEWLISASALNDPITPTSVQAHRTTAWSAFPNEVTRLPTGLVTIQRGGRRVLEYRTFIDLTAYQARLNTSDMSRKCQHLTASGIGVTQYQSLSQPVVWCCPSPYLTAEFSPAIGDALSCPIGTLPPLVASTAAATPVTSGTTLFGIAYTRQPDISYVAPFSFEHGVTLATGVQQPISSIAVQRGPMETSEYLYDVITDNNGHAHVEMLMPLMEPQPFLTDVAGDGFTVLSYGSQSLAFFLDSAMVPAGMEIQPGQASVDFYGLHEFAGKTVSFTLLGYYIGDFAIDSSGHVNIAFTATFTPDDLYVAWRDSFNYNALPSTQGDGKGTGWYGLGNTYQPVILYDPDFSTNAKVGYFSGCFGYKYRRRGQMLMPEVGSANGPMLGKTRRVHKAALYVDNAQEVSVGTDFSGTLYPAVLSKNPNSDVTTLGPRDFFTGVARVEIEDDYSFDGQVCWEQTKPVPGSVLAVAGFLEGQDI